MKEYQTADEHRAFIDGASEVIDKLLAMASSYWSQGRDDLSLEALRDDLVAARVSICEHITRAQELEKAPAELHHCNHPRLTRCCE